MSWIKLLQRETDNAETPRSFIYWAGILTIAAISSPNVDLNRGGVYLLRPNIYALLIGRSGLGKGLPIYIAQRLNEMVNNTRVLSGRSTIQSIIQELSKAYTTEDSKIPITDGRGFIVNGEFATSLQRDHDAFTILTGLYDSHYNTTWINKTKTGATERIKNPCITLFGGASPDHFADFVPQVSIQGGFIGRTLLIHEERRHKINSLMDDEAPEIDYELLAGYLNDIKSVKGRMRLSLPAKKHFSAWYHEFRPKEIIDKTGTVDRMPDHILKTAMCISLANKTDLIIEQSDIEEAIEACLSLVVNARKITGGRGQGIMAAQTKTVLDLVTRSNDFTISRKSLLAKGLGDFDSSELDRIIESLVQTGFIETINPGGNVMYKVTLAGQNLWKKLEG